eukprot:420355-Rhodomonas_salina.4
MVLRLHCAMPGADIGDAHRPTVGSVASVTANAMKGDRDKCIAAGRLSCYACATRCPVLTCNGSLSSYEFA